MEDFLNFIDMSEIISYLAKIWSKRLITIFDTKKAQNEVGDDVNYYFRYQGQKSVKWVKDLKNLLTDDGPHNSRINSSNFERQQIYQAERRLDHIDVCLITYIKNPKNPSTLYYNQTSIRLNLHWRRPNFSCWNKISFNHPSIIFGHAVIEEDAKKNVFDLVLDYHRTLLTAKKYPLSL